MDTYTIPPTKPALLWGGVQQAGVRLGGLDVVGRGKVRRASHAAWGAGRGKIKRAMMLWGRGVAGWGKIRRASYDVCVCVCVGGGGGGGGGVVQ